MTAQRSISPSGGNGKAVAAIKRLVVKWRSSSKERDDFERRLRGQEARNLELTQANIHLREDVVRLTGAEAHQRGVAHTMLREAERLGRECDVLRKTIEKMDK